MTERGKVRLYACGGAGGNIAYLLSQTNSGLENEPGFAELTVCYLDTSRSNLRKDIDEDHVYVVKTETSKEGAGKIRSENYDPIQECLPAMLQKFKPADLNIVLASAGGGTGSVIAPLVAAELLDRDCAVVVLSVGSTDSELNIVNTLNTLKSYGGVVKRKQKSLIMRYIENNNGLSRTEVDKDIGRYIDALSLLFSKQNLELDSQDLKNWLRPDRTSSNEPMLGELWITTDNKLPDATGNSISVATLAAQENDYQYGATPDYMCNGFVPDGVSTEGLPMHYVITDNGYVDIAKRLQNVLNEKAEVRNARLKKASLVQGSEHDGNGMVL